MAMDQEPKEYVAVGRVNGKGLWTAQRVADEPEEWFTVAAGEGRKEAIERAAAKWPDLPMYVEDDCIECGGLGELDDGDGPDPCPTCDGSGVVSAVWSGR